MMKDVTGGYWGLMVILSAFMIQMIAFGISLSIGIYNIEFLEINDDAFAVSLVAAINTGVFLGSGPLASFLMNHISHRSLALIGSALSSCSMLCMPFIPSLEYMYVIFGVFTGLGFCFVYIPSHVMSGLYYTKHQSLATGVATAGSGLGMTVFPILVGYLIEQYTWRPSFLILAGICFNLFVFALLLRPLPTKVFRQAHEEHSMLDLYSNNVDVKQEKKPVKNFEVFCIFHFNVYFFSNILWNTGINMLVMFGPDFLTTVGLTSMQAATMLTIFGFCTFSGSVLTGAVGNIRIVNRLYLYMFMCIMSGVAILVLPHAHHYYSIVMVHIVVGVGFGGILGLLIVLTADVLGPESLGDGVGYLMLSNGIGCFAGPPIVGALRDALGSYDVALYTSGFLLILSGIVMVATPIKNSFYKKVNLLNEFEVPCVDETVDIE